VSIETAITNIRKVIAELKELGDMVTSHDTVNALERQIARLERAIKPVQPLDYAKEEE